MYLRYKFSDAPFHFFAFHYSANCCRFSHQSRNFSTLRHVAWEVFNINSKSEMCLAGRSLLYCVPLVPLHEMNNNYIYFFGQCVTYFSEALQIHLIHFKSTLFVQIEQQVTKGSPPPLLQLSSVWQLPQATTATSTLLYYISQHRNTNKKKIIWSDNCPRRPPLLLAHCSTIFLNTEIEIKNKDHLVWQLPPAATTCLNCWCFKAKSRVCSVHWFFPN